MQVEDQEASSDDAAPGASRTRILHVIHGLEYDGGIEVWLLHLLRHMDLDRYQTDLLVLGAPGGTLEQDFRTLGCGIHFCSERDPLSFARHFSRILANHGPYGVVHSHVHYFGGLVVRLAAWHGVPIRIVHSRNDTRRGERQTSSLRRAYTWLMRRWIREYATSRIAISSLAAEDLFGAAWRESCPIVYSSRDFSAFGRRESVRQLRPSLGLPHDALVIGHVGKFHQRKNHGMIVDVAAEVMRREPRARLLLIGDGTERESIRQQASALGIDDRIVFAGARNDVPQLLEHAMDVFLFPSHFEGLGLAIVEAQAAGLPCVIADHLPAEVDVVPGLVQRRSLSAPHGAWASAILDAVSRPRPTAAEALAEVRATDFNVEQSADRIARIYDKERARIQDPRT